MDCDGSLEIYNSSQRARAAAMALLGGMLNEREARALFAAWSCPTNRGASADEASVISEIHELIGSVYDPGMSSCMARKRAAAARHDAISAFVKTFRTKSFVQVYVCGIGETNVPEGFYAI